MNEPSLVCVSHSLRSSGDNLRETHPDSSICLAIWGEVAALVSGCFSRWFWTLTQLPQAADTTQISISRYCTLGSI